MAKTKKTKTGRMEISYFIEYPYFKIAIKNARSKIFTPIEYYQFKKFYNAMNTNTDFAAKNKKIFIKGDSILKKDKLFLDFLKHHVLQGY